MKGGSCTNYYLVREYVYYSYFEKLVNNIVYEENKQEVEEEIGTYIKKERLSLGLNQDYVCKDLCSISYFSRIENNQIRPSNDYLIKIFQKLNKPLPTTVEENKELAQLLQIFYKAYFNDDEVVLTSTYQQLINFSDNFRVYLAKLYFCNYQKLFIKGKELVKFLYSFTKSYSRLDLELLLYAISEHYYLQANYQLADQFIMLLFKISNNKMCYSGKVNYLYAKLLIKINNPLKAIYFIRKAETIFKDECNYHYCIKVQLLIASLLIESFPDRAEQIINQVLELEYTKLNLKYLIYCYRKLAIIKRKSYDYEAAYSIYQQILNLDYQLNEVTLMEYLELLILFKKNNEALQIIFKIKKTMTLNYLERCQLIFYRMLISNASTSKKIRLLRYIINYAETNYDYPILKKWNLVLIEILEREGHYDKCCEIYKQLINQYK